MKRGGKQGKKKGTLSMFSGAASQSEKKVKMGIHTDSEDAHRGKFRGRSREKNQGPVKKQWAHEGLSRDTRPSGQSSRVKNDERNAWTRGSIFKNERKIKMLWREV